MELLGRERLRRASAGRGQMVGLWWKVSEAAKMESEWRGKEREGCHGGDTRGGKPEITAGWDMVIKANSTFLFKG